MDFIHIQDFIVPDGIGIPIGGSNKPNYVLLEVHYDNPNLDSGITMIQVLNPPAKMLILCQPHIAA